MWSQGMFLQPQHFQYQDEFHQHQLGEASQRSGPFHWGVQALEVDEAALAQGRLQLSRLKVVFPDGTLVDAPQHDPLPPARDLGELEGLAECKIQVALRLAQPHAANVVDDEQRRGQQLLFHMSFASVPDLLDGESENEVTPPKRYVCSRMEGECQDGSSDCSLVRLNRTAAHG